MHVLSQIKLSHSKNHAVPQSVLVNKEETWRAWNAGAKWTGIQVMTSFSRVNDHPWNSLVRDGQSTDAGRLALSAHVSGPAPFFNPPASFHATHGVSEERRGTLLDSATPTTCILWDCGGSTGWRGGYPWGASCKERPGCFWNTGQPTPHVNVSL